MTRLIALIPAVVVIYLAGEGSTQHLLVLSQVILSLQLSFAVIPLIHFTSNRRNMGTFATPLWGQVLAWLTAAIIVALNGKLVLDKIGDWVAAGGRVGEDGRADPGWLAAWPRACTAIAAGGGAAPGLGDAQAVAPPVAGLDARRRASSSTGCGRSGRAAWRRSAWPWSTTRPTPRSSTAP